MFNRLQEMVIQYNNSNNGKAILQIYNSTTHTPFILCIVTGLMRRVSMQENKNFKEKA